MPLKGNQTGGIYCAVKGCRSCGGKIAAWRRAVCQVHGDHQGVCCKLNQPYKLHRFPSSQEGRAEWIPRVQRPNYKVTQQSRVCSLHFVDGKPSEENPNPSLSLVHEPEIPAYKKRVMERQLKLKLAHPQKRRMVKLECLPTEAVIENADKVKLEVACQTDDSGLFDGGHGQRSTDTEMLAKCMESLSNVLNYIRTKHSEAEGNKELPLEVLGLVNPMFLVKDEVDAEDDITHENTDDTPFWNSEQEPEPVSPVSRSESDAHPNIVETGFNESETTSPSVLKNECDSSEELNKKSFASESALNPETKPKKPKKQNSVKKASLRSAKRNSKLKAKKIPAKAKATLDDTDKDVSFSCPKCDDEFQYEYQLIPHLAAHAAVEIEKCPYCGVQGSKYKIHDHIDSVHLGRRLQCIFCGFRNPNVEQMKLHFYNKHPENARKNYNNFYTIVFMGPQESTSDAAVNVEKSISESNFGGISSDIPHNSELSTTTSLKHVKTYPAKAKQFSTTIPTISRSRSSLMPSSSVQSASSASEMVLTKLKFSVPGSITTAKSAATQSASGAVLTQFQSNSGSAQNRTSPNSVAVLNKSKSDGNKILPNSGTITTPSKSGTIHLLNSRTTRSKSKSVTHQAVRKDGLKNVPNSGTIQALLNSGTGQITTALKSGSSTIPIVPSSCLIPVNANSGTLQPLPNSSNIPIPGGQQGQGQNLDPSSLVAVPNGKGQFLILQVVPPQPPGEAGTFKCSTCDQTFTDKALFRTHLRMHLSLAQNKYTSRIQILFNCKKCDKVFNRVLSLQRHVKAEHPFEPETFLCSFCGKSFGRKGGFKTHVERVHSRDRKFKCKLCPSKFFTRHELRKHDELHRGGKEKECPHCGEMKQLNNFKSHIEYVHEGKRFKCNFCDALINQKCQIKTHLLLKHLDIAYTTSTGDAARVIYVEPTHGRLGKKRKLGQDQSSVSAENPTKKSKPSPHRCNICNVTFHDKNTLEVHRIHHDMDPEYRHQPRRRVQRIDQEETKTKPRPDPDNVHPDTVKQNENTSVPVLVEKSETSQNPPETDLITEIQQALDVMSSNL